MIKKTAESAWNNCLAFIQDNINNEQAYKTWFEPIKAVKLVDNSLSIQVPSKFFYEWLEEHYVKLLKVALTKELGPNAKLLYEIQMEKPQGNKPAYTERLPSSNQHKPQAQNISLPPNEGEKVTLLNPFDVPGARNIKIDSQLNPNYNFDRFLGGDANQLARSAGMAVANKPGGTSFNPLFIFGGVGLGKTHLAHAIGLDIKQKHPEKTVLYVTIENFSQQYQDAVRRNKRVDFIHFYQAVDVLIVDDIQFLSGKAGTQEVFFHIFNHLHQNGNQVVMTSDKAPVDMMDVEERLLSRLKWGLSAELLNPDFDTRKRIIIDKLYQDGVEFPEDIVDYLANNITTNIREMEGALISLIAHATLNRQEVTIDLAKKVIKNYVKTIKKEISIDLIQEVVSNYFDLDVETLKSKTRKRHIVQARQISMYFAKKYTKASLASIGSHTGKRDHSTVLHACKTVDNLSSTDKKFKTYVDELQKKLNMHN